MSDILKSEYINEQLYQSIRKDILTLRYKPGDKLSENSVSTEYGVSRSPVRKVFQRLESEGYVNILPQRGTFVSKLDYDFINNIIYMRYCVEKDMMNHLMQEQNTEIFDKLNFLLDKQKELIGIENPDLFEFSKLDNEFHQTIYYHQNKMALWQIIENNNVYTRFRMLYLTSDRLPAKTYQEHKELLHIMKTDANGELPDKLSKHLYGDTQTIEAIIKNKYQSYFLPLPF